MYDLVNTYVHKTVERRRAGVDLKFLTSQSLFSSNAVDPGTNLLLRTIASHAEKRFTRCLDVGCGYGAVGLSLVAAGTVPNADLVDRDALALEFARENAKLNGLKGVEVFPSLGLDDVHFHGYDLIVSNLPGKAGEHVLNDIMEAALEHLGPGGQVWCVVVSPLWPVIEKMLSGAGAQVIHVEHGPRHTAFGYSRQQGTKPRPPRDSLAEVYKRNILDFRVMDKTIQITTSRGIPEFDGLSYTTQLLLEQLYRLRRLSSASCAVFNVGQGFVPVALLTSRMAARLDLIDRDLLALRTSERNLEDTGPGTRELHHQVGWLPESDVNYDLVAGVLRADEPRDAVEAGISTVIDRLRPDGTAVIAGGSTPVTRIIKTLESRQGIGSIERQKYRGASVVTVTRRPQQAGD